MPVASIQNQSLFYKDVPKRSFFKQELIQQVAIRSLLELAITLAVGAAVCFFTASPASALFLVSILALQFIANTILRSIGAINRYKKGGRADLEFAGPVPALSFALLTGTNAHTLIHETGHALAAKALYRTTPKIEISPFRGGATQFSQNLLAPLGKKIGRRRADWLVTASGAGLSLLVSSILLAVGLMIRKKKPVLAQYLIAYGGVDSISHAAYAASAYFTSPHNLAHDFVHLAKIGTPPILSAIGLAAIPLLIGLSAFFLQRPAASKIFIPMA